MSYFPMWTDCQNTNWNQIQLYTAESYPAGYENQTSTNWL